MAKPVDVVLSELAGALRAGLGEDLVSCCVYGSTVRGDAIAGVSDINLLVVVRGSSSDAHDSIARVIALHPKVEPFVLEVGQLERTARCFAPKFASIQHDYRVLAGIDPLKALTYDAQLERLLCEQAVRNLRLRITHAYVVRGKRLSYPVFLGGCVPSIFVQLTEILRLNGREVPEDFADRIPAMQTVWGDAASVLPDLLRLRRKERSLSEAEVTRWHDRVLQLLDAAIDSIEHDWGATTPPRP